jgi:hypothetical protein
MAYIHLDHPVGATRYIYDSTLDTVARVTIDGITATSSDKGYSGDFNVTYMCKCRNGERYAMNGDNLHTSADSAFPVPELTTSAADPAQEGGAA